MDIVSCGFGKVLDSFDATELREPDILLKVSKSYGRESIHAFA